MRSDIRHAPSGLTLDFSMPDFGGPEQAAIIQAWRDNGHHAKRGEFVCVRHELMGADMPELYLADHGDRAGLFAAHYPDSGLAGTHRIYWSGGMSDEHKRQVEYMIRPATALGWETATEATSADRSIRSDFIIQGPAVLMAGEVQRSDLAIPAARARTTKTRNAGREPLWLFDRPSHPLHGQVPSVGLEARSWDPLPPAGTVAAAGMQDIRAVRCQDLRGVPCPRTGTWRRCGGWHPGYFPLQGILADEVAERFPAGELVTLARKTTDGRLLYVVTTAAAKRLHVELVGEVAVESARERAEAHWQGPTRIECKAELAVVHPLPPPPSTPINHPIPPQQPTRRPSSRMEYACEVCGEVIGPFYADMTSAPHEGCLGRFQPILARTQVLCRCSKCGLSVYLSRLVRTYPHSGCGGVWIPDRQPVTRGV